MSALLDHQPGKGGPVPEAVIYGETMICPPYNWCIGLHNGDTVVADAGRTCGLPDIIERDNVFASMQRIEGCDK